MSLAPYAGCDVTVAFSPYSPGPKTTALRVEATPGSTEDAVLTGTAL